MKTLHVKIEHLSECDNSDVLSVARDLILSSAKSNAEVITTATKTIILFSITERGVEERASMEIIGSLYNYMNKKLSVFPSMMLSEFKKDIILLTDDWMTRNRLADNYKHAPYIYEDCFIYCLYNFAEIIRD